VRFFIVFLVLVFPVLALADGVKIITRDAPNPVYPPELRASGVEGQVRAGFTVYASGAVGAIYILESDHPQFASAVEEALALWRFKPWVATDDEPGSVNIIAPFVFRVGDSARPIPLDGNTVLLNIPCSRLNQSVVQQRRHQPGQHLRDLSIFQYTRDYLSTAIIGFQLSNSEKATLQTELTRAVPKIVASCRANPDSRYADYLPDGFRRWL
jgi:protein TonB